MENESVFKKYNKLTIQKHDEFGIFKETEYLKINMTDTEWDNFLEKTEKEFLKDNPYIINL